MKLPRPHRFGRPRGAVLVFALLISAVAVLGLTYWSLTVAARARYVEGQTQAVKRRIARDNGRVLARSWTERRVLADTDGTAFSRGIGTYFTATDSYDWGGIEMNSTWSGPTLQSNTACVGVNRISLANGSGFGLRTAANQGLDLPLHLLDGNNDWSYRWQARSCSAFLAGDLLSIHNPSETPVNAPVVAGTWNVHGRGCLWHAGNSGTYNASTLSFDKGYLSDAPIPAFANAGIRLSNYPPVLNRTYAWTGSEPSVAGSLNVVWNDASPGYTLKNRALDGKTTPSNYTVKGDTASTSYNGFSSNGSGGVTVDLNNATLSDVVIENCTTIDLTGQSTTTEWSTANTLPVVLIVYHETASSPLQLWTVRISGKNNRRLIFAIRKESGETSVAFNFLDANTTKAGTGPNYRLMLIAEKTPLTFTYSGNAVNLTGGIMTDRGLTGDAGSGNSISLYRETEPQSLAVKAPRRVWAEGFRAD